MNALLRAFRGGARLERARDDLLPAVRNPAMNRQTEGCYFGGYRARAHIGPKRRHDDIESFAGYRGGGR